MYDHHGDFCYGTIAIAPSPQTSGTTFSLTNAIADRFADPALVGEYNVQVWPANQLALLSNAETIRLTAKGAADSGGTGYTQFTCIRTQENTSARSIQVGGQIANNITDKWFSDLEENKAEKDKSFRNRKGIVYYHESMGYITRSESQIDADLDDMLEQGTTHIRVVQNPQRASSSWNSTSQFCRIIRRATAKGLTVLAGANFADGNDIIYATGTATSGSSTTLVDSSKSWTTNEWKDFTVEITSGTGAGQTAAIISNTATTLTIASRDGYSTFSIPPNSTSVYRISFPKLGQGNWTHANGYADRVVLLATEAFNAGADFFDVGNEISGHRWSDDPFTTSEFYLGPGNNELPTNIKALAQDVADNTGFTIDQIGYAMEFHKIGSWNDSGIGSLGHLGVNFYNNDTGFYNDTEEAYTAFGDKVWATEWSTETTIGSLGVSEAEWTRMLTERHAQLKKLGILPFAFCYRETTDDGFGYLKTIATGGEHDAWKKSYGGRSLADHNDTLIRNPTDGQVIVWDNTNKYWKPLTPSSLSGVATATHTHTLDNLSDVVIATPSANEVLAYNDVNSRWENINYFDLGVASDSDLQSHIGDTGNPHGVTADQVLPSQTGNSGKYLTTNGTTASWGTVSASAAGSNGQVQINVGGVLTGDAGFTYDPATDRLTIGALTVDTNTLYVDPSTNRVGIGTTSPNDELHVIGSARFMDAATPTKGYRFRTSGGALDWEIGGAALYLSTYPNGDISGTQRNFLQLEASSHTAHVEGLWYFRTGTGAMAGDFLLTIDGNASAGTAAVIFNSSSGNKDMQFKGVSDQYAGYFDASAGMWGFGTNTPGAKVHIKDGGLRFENSTDSKSYEWNYDAANDYFYVDEFGVNRHFIIKNGGDVLVRTSSTTPQAKFHVEEGTVGDEVFRLSSIATNDDPNYRVLQGRVATTDATVTTIQIIPITASNTFLVETRVVARRTGGTAGTAEDGAAYVVYGTYKNVSGTATLIGSLTVDYSAESQAGWDATLTVSGANVLVRVTGATNNNIVWHSTTIVQNLSS